jgi:hypothetical protein
MRYALGIILASLSIAGGSAAFAANAEVGTLPVELGCQVTHKSGGILVITCADGRTMIRSIRRF